MPQRSLHTHVNAEWFTITRFQNLQRDPSTDVWIKEMWNVEKNETMSFAGKWTQLEVIAVHEPSQIQIGMHVSSHAVQIYT